MTLFHVRRGVFLNRQSERLLRVTGIVAYFYDILECWHGIYDLPDNIFGNDVLVAYQVCLSVCCLSKFAGLFGLR